MKKRNNLFRLMVTLFAMLSFFGIVITGFSQEAGTFKDPRDGKVYKTVKIGNQTWFAENLAYKPKKGNYFVYMNDQSNAIKYGYLYDWETAKKVVPVGWHLPTKIEWDTLYNYLGADDQKVFTAIIEGGSSGFNALFGGFYLTHGAFSYPAGSVASFWSSTTNDAAKIWSFCCYAGSSNAKFNDFTPDCGLSVRLIQD